MVFSWCSSLIWRRTKQFVLTPTVFFTTVTYKVTSKLALGILLVRAALVQAVQYRQHRGIRVLLGIELSRFHSLIWWILGD